MLCGGVERVTRARACPEPGRDPREGLEVRAPPEMLPVLDGFACALYVRVAPLFLFFEVPFYSKTFPACSR